MSALGEARGAKEDPDSTASPGSPRRARGAVVRAGGSVTGAATRPKQRRSRRAEAIDRVADVADRKAMPHHNTTRSARPRILAATGKLVAAKGYGPLRVCEITAEAGISHQAFYGHFANKRHAVALATSEELGAVLDVIMRGARRGEVWAERLAEDIDGALAVTYPAKQGPSQRLRRRLCQAICSQGGYEALRIAELVRVSRIGQGEFYRRYGGKRGCLQRIYGEVVEEIAEEVAAAEQADRFVAFARSIARDRRRAELLIRGASHLPQGPASEQGVATRDALAEFVGSLVDSDGQLALSPGDREAVAGALLEMVRSSVLAGGLEDLPQGICAFVEARRSLGRSASAQSGLAAV